MQEFKKMNKKFFFLENFQIPRTNKQNLTFLIITLDQIFASFITKDNF